MNAFEQDINGRGIRIGMKAPAFLNASKICGGRAQNRNPLFDLPGTQSVAGQLILWSW
jgi:hypothetical protein